MKENSSKAVYVQVFVVFIAFILIFCVPYLARKTDILNIYDETHALSVTEMRMGVLGFCLNFPLVNQLDSTNNERENTPEEDYQKQSIYSFLYSMYRGIGTVVSDKGVEYEFTFNTWGIGPTVYPDDDPQRFGKEAYRRLTDFPEIKSMINEKNGNVKILEVGCGTGAGANLTSHIHTESHYTALDMQTQAISTCKRMHAHEHVPGKHGKLECVQANGMNMPFGDSEFDIVIVSETHIAEYGYLTEEDLKILGEIRRVLKPNGYFSWGNALVTETWDHIENYMRGHKDWEIIHFNDVTDGAILARDQDFDRVEAFFQSSADVVAVVHWFPQCKRVLKHILLDFYRHPGTRLYEVMVDGRHKYKQAEFRLTK